MIIFNQFEYIMQKTKYIKKKIKKITSSKCMLK